MDEIVVSRVYYQRNYRATGFIWLKQKNKTNKNQYIYVWLVMTNVQLPPSVVKWPVNKFLKMR